MYRIRGFLIKNKLPKMECKELIKYNKSSDNVIQSDHINSKCSENYHDIMISVSVYIDKAALWRLLATIHHPDVLHQVCKVLEIKQTVQQEGTSEYM